MYSFQSRYFALLVGASVLAILPYSAIASELSLSHAQIKQLVGEVVDDESGASVASAGDVNNDGYDDTLIGAYGNDAGAAYLIYGQSTALSDLTLNATTTVKFTGEAVGDRAGISVSSAGDVNNDGYDDILVGANGNDAGGNNSGAAYLIYGQSAALSGLTLNATTTVKFTGEADIDDAGISVASAGDTNNDGYDDILIGAQDNNGSGTGAGATYLIYGQSTALTDFTLSATATVKFTGEAADDRVGTSVASAGDTNNDGYDDILIGAHRNDADGSNAGAAYLIYGQSTALSDLTLNATTTVKFTGEAVGDNAGYSVDSAGDVNNDGYDDILIGAYSVGATYLIYGQSAALSGLTLNATTTVKFTGEAVSDNAGYSVASAGDTNNDGYDDLLIGAYRNDAGGSDAGAVYLIYGQSAALADLTLSTTTTLKFTGEAADDSAGYFVSSAGDTNNDGYDDILIGAYRNDAGGSRAGATYLVYPQPTTITVTGSNPANLECTTTYTDAGATASTDPYSGTASTISTTGSIVNTTLGTQTLTYTSTANFFNITNTATRTVTISDTTTPIITLAGEAIVALIEGDAYTDAGATATDSCQGDLTSSIIATNPVDVDLPDTYVITYDSSDASGNVATQVIRTVTIGDLATTTNGKYVNLTVDGDVIDRIKVNKKKFSSKYRKLKTTVFYDDYTTVALLTTTKTKAKLTVLRLTSSHTLKKEVSKTFRIEKRNKLSLKFKTAKHRFTVTVGKGRAQTKQVFRLTSGGKLKLVEN